MCAALETGRPEAAATAPAEPRTCAYIDFDVGGHRAAFARGAAFIDATDTRYGWSSKDIRSLGGSERLRIADFFSTDHDFAGSGPIRTGPPIHGNRVVVELFPSVAPLACENFMRLCSGHEGVGACGKKLCFEGSQVHRVQTGFVIQGGDFVFG